MKNTKVLRQRIAWLIKDIAIYNKLVQPQVYFYANDFRVAVVKAIPKYRRVRSVTTLRNRYRGFICSVREQSIHIIYININKHKNKNCLTTTIFHELVHVGWKMPHGKSFEKKIQTLMKNYTDGRISGGENNGK